VLLDTYFADNPVKGTYHVTNQGSCSWRELAEYVVDCKGLALTIQPISSEDLKRPARRPRNSLLSNEKFNSLCKFSLRSWQEAVKEYVANYG